jgi:hypothetical protein
MDKCYLLNLAHYIGVIGFYRFPVSYATSNGRKSKALKKTYPPTQAYNNNWTLLRYCKKGRFLAIEKPAELSLKSI